MSLSSSSHQSTSSPSPEEKKEDKKIAISDEITRRFTYPTQYKIRVLGYPSDIRTYPRDESTIYLQKSGEKGPKDQKFVNAYIYKNGKRIDKAIPLDTLNATLQEKLSFDNTADFTMTNLVDIGEITSLCNVSPLDQIPFVQYSWAQKAFRFIIGILPIGWIQMLFRNQIVNEGEMGLIWNNGIPEILPPGRHVLLSPFSEFKGIVSESDPIIEHGPIQIITVKKGQLGHVSDNANGQFELLTPGRHIIHSSTRKYRGMVDLDNRQTGLVWTDKVSVNGASTEVAATFSHDVSRYRSRADTSTVSTALSVRPQQATSTCDAATKIIRIETGEIGLVNRGGHLTEVQPGLHLVISPDRFVEAVPTTMNCIEVPLDKGPSKDNIPVNYRASIFYKVTEPTTTFSTLTPQMDAIKNYLIQTAKVTLCTIIRGSVFADIGQHSDTSTSHEGESKEVKQTSSTSDSANLRTSIHTKLVEAMRNKCKAFGIEISDIRIDHLDFDAELQSRLSSAAITSTTIQVQRLNIAAEVENKVAAALGEARAVEARAKGEALACIEKAKGQAQATQIMTSALVQRELNLGPGTALAMYRIDKQTEALNNANVIYAPWGSGASSLLDNNNSASSAGFRSTLLRSNSLPGGLFSARLVRDPNATNDSPTTNVPRPSRVSLSSSTSS